jgi:hypothetical protein
MRELDEHKANSATFCRGNSNDIDETSGNEMTLVKFEPAIVPLACGMSLVQLWPEQAGGEVTRLPLACPVARSRPERTFVLEELVAPHDQDST